MTRKSGGEVACSGFAMLSKRQFQCRFASKLIVVGERVIVCRRFSTAC